MGGAPAAQEFGAQPDGGARRDADFVSGYYDRMTGWYHFGYSAAGLHYGWWEPGTRSLRQAIVNHKNRQLAALGPIDPRRHHLLDAGCGAGATALHFARHSGARVTGLTISPQQAELARRRARREGCDDRVRFEVRNFCDSGLPAASFSHAYATESSCYAEDKRDFLREMHRLLAPGGRLVIADFYTHQRPEAMPWRHRLAYDRFCTGFALPNLPCWDDMRQWIADAGFRLGVDRNITPRLMRSVTSIRRRGLISLPWAHLLRALRLAPADLVPHLHACIHQDVLFKEVGTYRLLTLFR